MAVETAFRSDELFTQEEFWAWLDTVPATDVHRYELLGGRIVMTPPAGWGHAYVESNLQRVIARHVHERGLGRTLGSSAGYDLPTGDTLEPDFSFISNERWGKGPKVRAGGKGFLATVPDLVVEILSPSTARRDRTEKKDVYAQSGVEEYWIVDGPKRRVFVFSREGGIFGAPETTTAGAVRSRLLPDLRVTIDEIFGDLAPSDDDQR
jgi:Uma2 family endonuclease